MEATPAGILYKEWEASPAGKKVYASEEKIRKSIRDYSNMEAVVTSLSLPLGARLGFGVMVSIGGDDYILSFGPEQLDNKEFQQLHSLKVNDRIIIKSRGVSHAPKYAYPIVSGDYIERDSKIDINGCPVKVVVKGITYQIRQYTMQAFACSPFRRINHFMQKTS